MEARHIPAARYRHLRFTVQCHHANGMVQIIFAYTGMGGRTGTGTKSTEIEMVPDDRIGLIVFVPSMFRAVKIVQEKRFRCSCEQQTDLRKIGFFFINSEELAFVFRLFR